MATSNSCLVGSPIHHLPLVLIGQDSGEDFSGVGLSLAHGAGGGAGAPSEDSHNHMLVWKKEIFPTKPFLFWRNRWVLSRHNKIHPSEPTVVCDTFPLAQRSPPSLKFMS